MKHEAIFYGIVKRKVYRFDTKQYYYHSIYGRREPGFYSKNIKIEDKEFLRLEIDNPPIEINEKVFIEEINETIEIIDRVRNVKGGYIYYTQHVIEIIEDEETEKSRIEAEKEQKEYNENQKGEIVQDFEQELNKKWYQFWK